MEISSQMTTPEVRWRREGVAANSLLPPNTNIILQQQQQQRIDSMTRSTAALTMTEGGDEAGVGTPGYTAVNDGEDRLAPLPSEIRIPGSERRKGELKNRKTSTAVAAAAAGLKTLPGILTQGAECYNCYSNQL